MIRGAVSGEGVPEITVIVGGREFAAIIDTGFNGDLEIPDSLRADVNPRYAGRFESILAGGQIIEESAYLVDFPFDGEVHTVMATFVDGSEILLGTRLLGDYRLQISFVTRLVELEHETA